MFNRIRRYSLRDKDSIRKICLDNAKTEGLEENDLSNLLLMYCDYYIENEQETCFVAVDEKDEVIGYLLCAPDYEKFSRIYAEEYVPKAVGYGIKNYVDAKMYPMSFAMYKTMYPTHFQMAVAEEYRQQGIGTKLLDVMKKDLLVKGKNKVMLICNGENYGAIEFCEKYGFKRIITTKLGVSYGMELKSDD